MPRRPHTTLLFLGRRAVPMALAGATVLFGCAQADPQAEPEEAGNAPHEIVIRGVDYAFQIPESVPAGAVQISFENIGEVPHEAVLVQLNDGVTAEQVAAAMEEGSDPRELMAGIAGILIADPGETAMGKLAVELESGRTYALICNFTDTEDDPPHIALGMMRIFQAT